MPANDNTLHLRPTFNRLAWSNLAAQSAEQIALAAAPIVAVLLLGVGEGQTGLLQTALTLPFILFAIPAGLLADRISRRWLMAGSEALRAIALLGILVLIWLGLLTLPLLALLGFLAGCGTGPHRVAGPGAVIGICRGTLRVSGGAVVRNLRAGARTGTATPSAAGDQGRRRIRVASSAAAAGVYHAVHLQNG